MAGKTVRIYGLSDLEDRRIRYVGRAVDPYRRFIRHIHEARKMESPSSKNRWISETLANGSGIQMQIMEVSDESGWQEAERRWIAALPDLLNACPGGNGGLPGMRRDPRSVERGAAKLRGRKMPEEFCRRISEACKGRVPWNKGRPRSGDVKRKISETKKKRFQDPEYLARYQALQRKAIAKNMTDPGFRHRMSAAQKGKVMSADAKRKISEALRGRHVSPDTRRKLSENAKKRWAQGGAAAFGLDRQGASER